MGFAVGVKSMAAKFLIESSSVVPQKRKIKPQLEGRDSARKALTSLSVCTISPSRR